MNEEYYPRRKIGQESGTATWDRGRPARNPNYEFRTFQVRCGRDARGPKTFLLHQHTAVHRNAARFHHHVIVNNFTARIPGSHF